MLEWSLLLARTLNELSAGITTAPQAEALLTQHGPHHVVDPEGLLGFDPLAASPIRLALARICHGAVGSQPSWLLLAPVPGRLAGLRGPAEFTAAALETSAVVVLHTAGTRQSPIAWVGQQVGPAVQWRLWSCAPVVPPADPREANRVFQSAVLVAANRLRELDAAAGARPDGLEAFQLGPAYPASSQQLLDRAWTVRTAAEQAMEQQHEVLSSHLVLNRERHLRELADAARDAVCSAASWPTHALQ